MKLWHFLGRGWPRLGIHSINYCGIAITYKFVIPIPDTNGDSFTNFTRCEVGRTARCDVDGSAKLQLNSSPANPRTIENLPTRSGSVVITCARLEEHNGLADHGHSVTQSVTENHLLDPISELLFMESRRAQ